MFCKSFTVHGTQFPSMKYVSISSEYVVHVHSRRYACTMIGDTTWF